MTEYGVKRPLQRPLIHPGEILREDVDYIQLVSLITQFWGLNKAQLSYTRSKTTKFTLHLSSLLSSQLRPHKFTVCRRILYVILVF